MKRLSFKEWILGGILAGVTVMFLFEVFLTGFILIYELGRLILKELILNEESLLFVSSCLISLFFLIFFGRRLIYNLLLSTSIKKIFLFCIFFGFIFTVFLLSNAYSISGEEIAMSFLGIIGWPIISGGISASILFFPCQNLKDEKRVYSFFGIMLLISLIALLLSVITDVFLLTFFLSPTAGIFFLVRGDIGSEGGLILFVIMGVGYLIYPFVFNFFLKKINKEKQKFYT